LVGWVRAYKAVDSGGDSGGGSSNGIKPPSSKTLLRIRSSNQCMDLQSGFNANAAMAMWWQQFKS